MMKPIRLILLSICAAMTLSACGGCSLVKTTRDVMTVRISEAQSDDLIRYAEDVITITRDAMNTFQVLELRHRETLKTISPEPNKLAMWLKAPVPLAPADGNGPSVNYPRGLAYVKLATRAVAAYQANRTPENEANLRSACKTLWDIKKQVDNNMWITGK